METMYYIGLDVHKRTISYCVKDVSGRASGQPEGLRQQMEVWFFSRRNHGFGRSCSKEFAVSLRQ